MPSHPTRHRHDHAFTSFHALEREGLMVCTRRNMLKASMAGIAGLTVPELLRTREALAQNGRPVGGKSVILLWMTGGPSHIDTWDMKPDRPVPHRGPFRPIDTKLPGVRICEHLPKMAAMLDRFTLIRSVNARGSNHEPNTVMQTGNPEAEPRTNSVARQYPAIGSVVAKHHGPNHPAMPPYVAFKCSDTHLAFGGYLGKQYDPFIGNTAATLPRYTDVGVDTGRVTPGNLFQLPGGLTTERLRRRHTLREGVDALRRQVDENPETAALDSYQQQAVELILGERAREAFDITREPERVRERYGKHLWHQEALLARRLVERGVSFVTVDLSYHSASGTWDTHGDKTPPYGGINSGLKPILPLYDHLVTTLVADLEERGLLESTLVISMGEFGRTPLLSEDDGRNHWPNVASMALAGGGLRHGQVIGATEPDGGDIAERPVTPGDLAATIYRHMGVPLDTTYTDTTGRPFPVVINGAPLPELF